LSVRSVAGTLVLDVPVAAIRRVRVVALNGACVYERSFPTPVRHVGVGGMVHGSHLVQMTTDQGTAVASMAVHGGP
jgi:hypothetical protein